MYHYMTAKTRVCRTTFTNPCIHTKGRLNFFFEKLKQEKYKSRRHEAQCADRGHEPTDVPPQKPLQLKPTAHETPRWPGSPADTADRSPRGSTVGKPPPPHHRRTRRRTSPPAGLLLLSIRVLSTPLYKRRPDAASILEAAAARVLLLLCLPDCLPDLAD